MFSFDVRSVSDGHLVDDMEGIGASGRSGALGEQGLERGARSRFGEPNLAMTMGLLWDLREQGRRIRGGCGGGVGMMLMLLLVPHGD